MKIYPFKVGDIVVPIDGSNYQSEIISIDFEDDTVQHRIISDGSVYEQSTRGMIVRYMLHPDSERLGKLKVFR